MLRALPAVPMPADVAERLEAALLTARTPERHAGDIVPLKEWAAGRPSRWKSFPYPAAAAVIVVLAIGGSVIAGLNNRGGSGHKATSTAAGLDSATGGSTIASGTDYSVGSLRMQVATIVNDKVPGAAADFPGLTNPEILSLGAATPSRSAVAPQAAPTGAATAASDTPDTSSRAQRSAPSGPLADPAALQRCIETLLVGKSAQPVLVDYASYNRVPATIIVLPDPDEAKKLDIYVLADTADCAGGELTAVAFLPAAPTPEGSWRRLPEGSPMGEA
jgi:hypothetical protein